MDKSKCNCWVKTIYILIIVTVSIVLGCIRDSQPSIINEICIENNTDKFKSLKICDYCCDVRYVQLEKTSPLIRAPALAAFCDMYFLVSDRSICLLYQADGRFMSQIGSRGQGPGEYGVIRKLQFDSNYNIYVGDANFVYIFNLNGEFLSRFESKIRSHEGYPDSGISSFAPVDDSIFVGKIRDDSGKELYKAVFFNKSGIPVQFVRNYIFLNKIQPYVFSGNGDADIFKFEEDIIYKERFNDTVFQINSNYCFDPRYIIKLGSYSLPKEVRELPMRDFYKRKEDFIEVTRYFEVKNHCLLRCEFHKHSPIQDFGDIQISGMETKLDYSVLGIYNKENNQMVFARLYPSGTYLTSTGLVNDYDGGVSFFPGIQVNDSILAMWADAFQLKEHVKSESFHNSKPKFPDKKIQLEKFANSLSDNDNPVLILCTFRK